MLGIISGDRGGVAIPLVAVATVVDVDATGGVVAEMVGTDDGAGAGPRLERRPFLSAAISCLRAMFSLWEDPSSERIAEISASRSEMSASSVEIYSV